MQFQVLKCLTSQVTDIGKILITLDIQNLKSLNKVQKITDSRTATRVKKNWNLWCPTRCKSTTKKVLTNYWFSSTVTFLFFRVFELCTGRLRNYLHSLSARSWKPGSSQLTVSLNAILSLRVLQQVLIGCLFYAFAWQREFSFPNLLDSQCFKILFQDSLLFILCLSVSLPYFIILNNIVTVYNFVIRDWQGNGVLLIFYINAWKRKCRKLSERM